MVFATDHLATRSVVLGRNPTGCDEMGSYRNQLDFSYHCFDRLETFKMVVAVGLFLFTVANKKLVDETYSLDPYTSHSSDVPMGSIHFSIIGKAINKYFRYVKKALRY